VAKNNKSFSAQFSTCVIYDIQNVRLHETTLCGLTKLDMDMQIFRKQQYEVMIYTGGLTW
jgi:hypothetical protein